jgi:diguanylate cyclase (GGDEF)-like protein
MDTWARPFDDEAKLLRYPTGEVHGTVLFGFIQACKNLHIIAPCEIEDDIRAEGWYPLDRLCQFQNVVRSHFQDASVILERAGIEFARMWFGSEGGRDRVHSGLDFLALQARSEGYSRVVRGGTEQVGRFELVHLDEAAGVAVVESSSPFSRDFERGVIIGGMLAPGDLWHVQVDNFDDPHRFVIGFKPNGRRNDQVSPNRVPSPHDWNPRLTSDADFVDQLYWRYQGLLEQQRRDHLFWQATNQTLERLARRMHELSRQMEDLAHQDTLTGLPNRRGILKSLEREYAISVRYGLPLSLAILDVDWFKNINDTHGHLVGDDVLKRSAAILAETLRRSDSVGRLSGEEFLLIFPGTSITEAVRAADKLRERLAQLDFDGKNGCFRITASLGVADRTADTEDTTELMRRADHALYEAKKGGRNRVERFLLA